MPRISDLFQSKYLKVADLQQGQALPINVRISHIAQEDVGTDDKREIKPILYFRGKDRGLVLNKTNALELAQLLGDDTDAWTDRVVGLTIERTTYKGQPTQGLRIVPAVQPGGLRQHAQLAQRAVAQRAPAPAAAPAPARVARRPDPEPDPEPDPDFTDGPGWHEPADNVDDDVPF